MAGVRLTFSFGASSQLSAHAEAEPLEANLANGSARWRRGP